MLIHEIVWTEEVRIRWVQTESHANALLSKIKDAINGGVNIAEEKLAEVHLVHSVLMFLI